MVSIHVRVKLLFVGFLVVLSGCTSPQGATADEKRRVIQEMRRKTLQDVYVARPEVEKEVKNAPGYAVFSNIETTIFFAGGGSGYGLHVNNLTGEET